MTATLPRQVPPRPARDDPPPMSAGQSLLGGVELGGTKCICLLGTGPDDIREQISIPTGREPAVALGAIVRTFETWIARHGPIAALGIASFGPLDLSPRSARYGYITTTPKH